jgi:hypothetical protein
VAGTDVVEQRGRPLRRSGPGRRLAVVLVVAVALTVTGADWQVRRQEAARVDRCVRVASGSVSLAEGQVATMTRYVSPALASSLPDGLRRGLLAMVSRAAARSTDRLRRARVVCDEVSLLPTHTRLRRTRAECLRLLEGELTYLEAVAADGRHTYEASGSVPGRCATR